jgi:Domain of unknown function (DUF4440)
MKFILSAFIVFLSLTISAQSSDEKAIALSVETLHNAMIDADNSTLEKITAKELSYGHSSGKVDNKTDFIGNIVGGKNEFKSINISNQNIIIADNIAIVRHSFNAEILSEGIISLVKLSILLIWKKDKHAWKLIARQAIKI